MAKQQYYQNVVDVVLKKPTFIKKQEAKGL